jgi:hypothetical protein
MENNLVKIDKWEDAIGYDEMCCEWFVCPNCDSDEIAENVNYCPNCGVKFEWTNSKNQD